MQLSATPAMSKGRLWTGRILSAVPALFMLIGGLSIVFVKPQSAVDSFAGFGYPERLITPIGAVEFLCALIYVIPRTAVLGAILLTAYFGGAIATHVRVNDPMFVAPIIVAVLVWGGLYLRDPRVAALIPLVQPRP